MASIHHNNVAFMVKLNAFLRHELLFVSEVSIKLCFFPTVPLLMFVEVCSLKVFHYTDDSPRLSLTQNVINLIS